MRLRSFAALLITLMVVQEAFALQGYSAMTESESFKDKTIVKVFKHDVRKSWTGARLNVSLHLDSGDAVVRLIDDAGTVRWQQAFASGGDANVQQTLDGTGLWKVELQLKKASGRYTIKLTAV